MGEASARSAIVPAADILFHLLIVAVLLVSLASVLVNLACFDGLTPGSPRSDAPLVSILVPARNEALNIEPCIRSLLAQDYPNFELLVLDDHSSDATADRVRALGVIESGARHRLLHGAELPSGWVGKNWACHQLAQAARGEFLFFTDADTTHAPGTTAATLAYAEKTGADLVSAWPRLITITWSEKLIIPMILLLGMVLFPIWALLILERCAARGWFLPRRIRRHLPGAANGQFMFWKRSSYFAIGGHEAVRHHLVEDMALGREIVRRMGEGMRLRNCESLRFATCRMYRSFDEVWEGFTKNIRAAFEDNLAGFLFVGLIQACCFLLPFVAIFFPHSPKSLVFLEIALIFLIRAILTWRFQTSWLGLVLHPIGHALCLAIGVNSWRRARTGGVRWKGRTYEVKRRAT